MMYFVQSSFGGPIKFGYCTTSERYTRRFSELQVGSPLLLVTVAIDPDADADKDRAIRKRLVVDRDHGDWFKPSEKVFDYVWSLYELLPLYEHKFSQDVKYKRFGEFIVSPPKAGAMSLPDQPINERRKCWACSWQADNHMYRPRKLGKACYTNGFYRWAYNMTIDKTKRRMFLENPMAAWEYHDSHPGQVERLKKAWESWDMHNNPEGEAA